MHHGRVDITLNLWLVTLAGIIALIAIDFIAVSRKPHEVGFREALLWSIFYIGIAVAFGIGLLIWQGSTAGSEFFAAYLVEKSLSVDNLFVFIIILTQFAVPSALHQRVLLVGVVLALVFRAVFIAIGAAALDAFSFTFVLFGALLIYTGIQLARHRNEDPDPSDNAIVRRIRKRYTFTDDYHGTKSFVRVNGKRMATPLLLVMIAIGSTDLLFALDSIPATFGVTSEPYIVFTANAFALLGLRALYFLLKGLLDKLIYLSLGLSIILVFIGVKLILTFAHGINESIPHIPTNVSLIVIGSILVITGLASWIGVRRHPDAVAHAGRITDSKHDEGE
jgi:tellurite resistance protein TerC